jgi:malate dehydrogenase (oxaloacetate-decarboxylating)
MTGWCERPIVLPLSNPTSRAEATPGDVLAWSDGRALVATGSPFEDVTVAGGATRVSQANNIYVFPGLGAGALAAGARSVTDGMLRAAAAAVADASRCAPTSTDAGLLPELEEVREVSRRIAMVVACAARDDGVGDAVSDAELRDRIDARRWTPDYPDLVGV